MLSFLTEITGKEIAKTKYKGTDHPTCMTYCNSFSHHYQHQVTQFHEFYIIISNSLFLHHYKILICILITVFIQISLEVN